MYSIKYANIHRFAKSALPTSSTFHKNCSSEPICGSASPNNKRRRPNKSVGDQNDRTIGDSSIDDFTIGSHVSCSANEPSNDNAIPVDNRKTSDPLMIKFSKYLGDFSIDNASRIIRPMNDSSLDACPPSTNFVVAHGGVGPSDVNGPEDDGSDVDDAFSCYLCTQCGRGCPTERDLAAHVEELHGETTRQDEAGSGEDDVVHGIPPSSVACPTGGAFCGSSKINHRALSSSSSSDSPPSRSPTYRRQASDELPPTFNDGESSSTSPSSWSLGQRRRQTLGGGELLSSTSKNLTSVTPQRRASDYVATPSLLTYKNMPLDDSPPTPNHSPPPTRRPTKRRRPGDAAATSSSAGSCTASFFTYACKLCPRTFGAASALNVHYTHTHRDKPQYDCEMCGAQFAVKRELATHRRLHDGQPTHRCHRCGKDFGTKQLLRKHELWHTGERTHICPQCNKAFFQKGHLTQHLMIHAGGRPHACRLCPKTFIFKFDLNRHMKIHAERVITANESQDESFNKNFTSETEHTECHNETEYNYENSANLSVNENCGNDEDKDDFVSNDRPHEGLSPTMENNEDSAIIQNMNDSTTPSTLNNFDSVSNLLINGSGLSTNGTTLSNAANNWAGFRDHLRNLHIGHLLAPILDQQLRRCGVEGGNDGQVLTNDLHRYRPWPFVNGNPHASSDPDAILLDKGGDETTSSDHRTSPSSTADKSTNDLSPLPRKIGIEPIEKAKKADFYEKISPRSSTSPHPTEEPCDQCSTLKQQLASCREKIGSLENVVREKQTEIEALKSNVQHVGCLAGSLFKTCAEYETLWLASDREISEHVRRLLSGFR